MKKIIITVSILAIAAASFAAGRTAGVRHAIQDSIVFTVECYDPSNPEENLRPDGYDQTIYIELDGETYERGMYQC